MRKKKMRKEENYIISRYDEVLEKFVASIPYSGGYAIRLKPELSVEENLDDVAQYYATVSGRKIIDPAGRWEGDYKIYELQH